MFLKVEIPINLPIKKTNCIIIFDEPLTIIDPGCQSEKTLNMIQNSLESHNKDLKDIKRIIVTHGHIDHFGVAETLRQISGAKVYIHEKDMFKAQRPHSNNDRYINDYKKTLQAHGSPQKGLSGIDNFFDFIKDMYQPLKKAQHIPSMLYFDNTRLEVIESPGHTSGSVVLYNPEEQLMFSGDTLIDGISPNPIIEYQNDGQRFASRKHYKETLKKLEKYSVEKIIGGHFNDIYDLKKLVKNYRIEWDAKKTKTMNYIQYQGSLNAYELMQLSYGELQEFQIFLGMSEVIGLLDYLEDQGKITATEKNGIITYSQA